LITEEVMVAGPLTARAPPAEPEPVVLLSERVEDTITKPMPFAMLTYRPPPPYEDVAEFPEMMDEVIVHDAEAELGAYMYKAPPVLAVFELKVDEMMSTDAAALDM